MLQFVADLVSREDGRQRTEDGTKRNRVHPNIAVPPQESPQGLHLLEHSGDEDPGHHAEHPLLRGNTNIKPPGSRGNASFKRTCPDQHSIFFFFLRVNITEYICLVRRQNWLPRRVMSAWHIAGILHVLEGWTVHECGDDMMDSEKAWSAAIRHGFVPLAKA